MINRIMKKGNRYLVDEFGASGKTLPPTSVRKEANHEQASMNSIFKRAKTRRYCQNQRFYTKVYLENWRNH